MSKMNILLISLQKDLDTIGLKYLHYCLLKHGYNSSLLNIPIFNPDNNKALESIRNIVVKMEPEFIGFSLMSLEYFNTRDLTAYLKRNFKSIPIVWGGIHPTISPESCLDHADYVCVGEGERTVLDIANAISKNEDVKNVNNICYMENGKIVRNPLHSLIENLDEIEPYEHIPINSFIQEENGSIAQVDRNIFKKYARYKGTIYSITTSRGCPFSCTYCCNNLISRLYNNNKIRRRSIKNIISELEKAIKDNREIEHINFQDDCFLACSDAYLKEFCKAYKEKINKPFIARSIPIYISRDRINFLKDAGLSWISLGLQSGSNRVCKEIYKRRSLREDFLKAAGVIKDCNIAAFYDIILDNPFETDEDRIETIQALIETPKPFYPQLFSLSLYLKTELYEKAKKECPEKIEDFCKKNFQMYQNTILNNLTWLAGFLDKRFMSKILNLYKTNPLGPAFRIVFFVSNLLTITIFEPLTYFRVIKLSQGGSYIRVLKIMPFYFSEGFKRYINQLKARRF